MLRAPPLLTLLAPFAAAGVLFVQSEFPAGAARTPEGWRVWSPRPALAPEAFADPAVNRAGAARGGALALAGGGKAAVHGAWERPVAGIRPRGWRRLTGYFRARGLLHPRLEVLARLDWRDAGGKRAGQPDYAYLIAAEGDWSRITLAASAPENAAAALIQLFLSGSPGHGLAGRHPSRENPRPAAAPGARRVPELPVSAHNAAGGGSAPVPRGGAGGRGQGRPDHAARRGYGCGDRQEARRGGGAHSGTVRRRARGDCPREEVLAGGWNL